MAASQLPIRFEYLLLRTCPPSEALTIRQTLQESLAQSFGLTASDSHLDVLWVGATPQDSEQGKEYGTCVVRVASGTDASRVRAAITASVASPRMELIRNSTFLPSLLVQEQPL
ncbi:hypothetical protein C8F01DRAFT_462848 [Mycena amicta]|nr:hypothetical protein C8F01DRAFT_462848 [Mycena amicta]